MPSSRFQGSLSSPSIYFGIDTGSHFLNATVDGFLKIGTVGASRALAEETYHIARKGNISSKSLEHGLKKMCKEGAYWGSIAGVYVGMEYGVERVRGRRDWKNAMIGGAITGALVSAVSSQDKDKIAVDAITGAAIATATKFINYLV